MIKDDKYAVVYNHIKKDYEAVTMTMYGFIPIQARELIQREAMKETFLMVRNGILDEYYERIIKNAI